MANDGNTENDTKLSQYPITFVEIIFAVVIGASVLYFHEFLFPPDLICLSSWALLTTYFSAITSWFGWHKSTLKYPYTISWAGQIRSVLDGVIVVTYVALLFFGSKTGSIILKEATNACFLYLWGFVVIFLLYVIAGQIRSIEYHDRKASNIILLLGHGGILLLGAVTYTFILRIWPQFLTQEVLWASVLVPLAIMASFRFFREWRYLPYTKILTIAVDMDGVLVEQVIPVLAKLKQEIGISLDKRDITDWEYAIGTTNIKREIERAELEEEFVRHMMPIEGAIQTMQVLSKKSRITVATSRDPCTNLWNSYWLKEHNIPYEQLLNTRTSGKTLTGVDILIDDYPGNIEEFIRNGPSQRRAILFAQPWNKDVSRIADLIELDRVRIAQSWKQVLALLDCCISWMEQSNRAKQTRDESAKYQDLNRYHTKYLLLMDAFSLVINYFAITAIAFWIIVKSYTNDSAPLWQLIILSLFALFSLFMFLMFTIFMFKPERVGNLRKRIEYQSPSDSLFRKYFNIIFPGTLWAILVVVFLSTILQGADLMPADIGNAVRFIGIIWLVVIPIASLLKLLFIDEKRP